MNIELKYLEQKMADKEMKSLALAVAIKTSYTNSILYNFSYQRISKEFHIDRRTAKRYVRQLKEDGLAIEKNNDLHIPRLYRYRKYFVGINKKLLQGKSLIEIERLLYGVLLKQKGRIQLNAAKTKQELLTVNKIRSLKKYKRLKSEASKLNLTFKNYLSSNEPAKLTQREKPNNEIKFSIQTLSRDLNVSGDKLYAILTFLQKQKVIRVQNNIKFIKKVKNRREAKPYLEFKHFLTQSMNLYSYSCNNYLISGLNM